ncbi:MAG: helix-turn-helix transcriptional regulator [Clostridia bacterium]|nr:helix-turn-helix transcriptional regulator [Clostridia bacterium]
MEFHEKLRELRNSRGLTQEDLADALYVSRTAISKWESGRGYPNIDSIKEISKYFSVSIDDLLSSDKLIYLAKKENKLNIQRMCDLFFGIVDILSFMLIILPLYPNPINGYIYSVNLFNHVETSEFNKLIYWIMYIALIVIGILKILLTYFKIDKGQKAMTICSMILSILSVILLAMTREAYAITVAFLLLILKGILIFNHIKK